VLDVNVRDLTGGFRCIRREVLEAVDLRTLRSQGYVFNIELTFRAQQAGFRIAEVPICFRDRRVGESKISLGVAVEALWLVPVLRYPWLGRRWPARKAPMADPALSAEPAPIGSLSDPAPVPEGASVGEARG
jgi:dolichol-phosphate mannosyltransferase